MRIIIISAIYFTMAWGFSAVTGHSLGDAAGCIALGLAVYNYDASFDKCS